MLENRFSFAGKCQLYSIDVNAGNFCIFSHLSAIVDDGKMAEMYSAMPLS